MRRDNALDRDRGRVGMFDQVVIAADRRLVGAGSADEGLVWRCRLDRGALYKPTGQSRIPQRCGTKLVRRPRCFIKTLARPARRDPRWRDAELCLPVRHQRIQVDLFRRLARRPRQRVAADPACLAHQMPVRGPQAGRLMTCWVIERLNQNRAKAVLFLEVVAHPAQQHREHARPFKSGAFPTPIPSPFSSIGPGV